MTPSLPDTLHERLVTIDRRTEALDRKIDHLTTIVGALATRTSDHAQETRRALEKVSEHLTRNRRSISHVETRTDWAIRAIRAGAVPGAVGGITGLLSVVVLHLLGIGR